jgi:hypothetical protein
MGLLLLADTELGTCRAKEARRADLRGGSGGGAMDPASECSRGMKLATGNFFIICDSSYRKRYCLLCRLDEPVARLGAVA